MITFPVGRIDMGRLIPFVVADPIKQVNNSTVPLRGHKYLHGLTNYLLELHHILHVCFSHSTSSRWTLQMWRTDEGRFRMTPACPSPAPPVVCLVKHISCISKKEILLEGSLVRPFGLRTNIPVLKTGAASVPSMSLPLLPVDQFKHLVSKMVKKFSLFVVFSHLNHGKHFQNIQK